MRRRLEDAVRSLAALPDENWGDIEWDWFVAAQKALRDELALHDRRRDQ